MLSRQLLTLDWHFDRIHLGFAASLRMKQERFGGNGHGDGPVDFFEEVVDDGGRRFPRFFSTAILGMNFFAIDVILHI